jgi:hypothetical protein
VDKTAAHLTPVISVLAADDDDLCRHAQVAQGAMEAHRLLGLISDLRLDDEEVDIAVRIGLLSTPLHLVPNQSGRHNSDAVWSPVCLFTSGDDDRVDQRVA